MHFSVMVLVYTTQFSYIAGVNMRDLDLLVGFSSTLKERSIFVSCIAPSRTRVDNAEIQNEYKLAPLLHHLSDS